MDGDNSIWTLLSFGDQGWGDEFLRGTWLTLQISVCAYLLGMVLGLAGAGARLAQGRFARAVGDLYTTMVRAVPELLLILLLYYAATSTLNRILDVVGLGGIIEVNAFVAAVSCLGFIQGAYMTEVFRGAILAVPKGQMEAARAYGMSPALRFRRILFPLMIRYALPGLANLWLVVLKDSSLISVVGYSELLFTGKTAASSTKFYFFFYLTTAAVYLILTVISNIGIGQIERLTSRGVRRA
jgi:polar amino acid transport system permease protein